MPLWLDTRGRTADVLSGWFSVVGRPYVRVHEALDAARSNALKTWSATLSWNLTHVPAGEVLIHDARLFDPRDLSVTAHTAPTPSRVTSCIMSWSYMFEQEFPRRKCCAGSL